MNTDPITFALIESALKGIVDEMNVTLFRSAYSPVITEGRDIGGAVFNRRGELLAQGSSDLAVFVGMLEYFTRAVTTEFGDTLQPGDVFINNDPFAAGTHFNDVGVLKPVFFGGELAGFVAIVGHWPDVGGAEPGSFASDARDYHKEGLRIPPARLYRGNELNKGLYDVIFANVRIPEEREGDVRAQVGAVNVGERRLKELFDRYGTGIVFEVMDEMIAHSEKLMRAAIRTVPAGSYEWTDTIDNGHRVHLRLTVAEESLSLDFHGSDPQSDTSANSTASATASAVYVTLKSLFPEIPMNHGCFIPIELIMPEGTVVNARPPAAISMMAATVYERVIGVVLGALSQAIPDRIAACPYGLINLTIGGTDPRNGREYVAYLFSEGGFGASSWEDGSSGLVSLYGGGARITPVEVFERRYPMRFLEWTFRQDSEGAGRFRGGFGARKTFTITRGSARVTALGDRESHPPFGVQGGESAAPQGLHLVRSNGDEENLTLKAVGRVVGEGERVIILGSGGGGYGDPLDRDPELVLADVRDELLSVDRARKVYGVVVALEGGQYALDRGATERLRAERREDRP
ncbi:hydantoinase B/oxoprolinase family protein [Limnochorda pilosa]|uniref:N-methylhydantoinase n=1 Tax=Limnochorda pilosa TaxID=1555112 RepID=A0A0K2SGX9_LIMPI|nr:hydantoinase B/oxoprolinase family protein [Limnochorda pilosa]BAS26371.1 N-methylhydantoinase [Limnochorda pilosa]